MGCFTSEQNALCNKYHTQFISWLMAVPILYSFLICSHSILWFRIVPRMVLCGKMCRNHADLNLLCDGIQSKICGISFQMCHTYCVLCEWLHRLSGERKNEKWNYSGAALECSAATAASGRRSQHKSRRCHTARRAPFSPGAL